VAAPDTLQARAGDRRTRRRLPGRLRLRLPRYTIRLRLAVLYGSVFLVTGTLLLGLVFLTLRASTHGTVLSAQGAAAKLVERHSVGVAPSGAAPGATLSARSAGQ
jgi:hypothetical protein